MNSRKDKEGKNTNNSCKDSLENDSFHQAIGPCLVSSQFFGMLPITGIMSKDENGLEFRWTSIRAIYALFFLICGAIDSGSGVRRLLRHGFNIGFAEALLFFIMGIVKAAIIFRIAIHWKRIMLKWKKNEEPFLNYPYNQIKGWKLKTIVRSIFFIITFVFSCEFVIL